MNLELARFNMIEQQTRTWEVLDQRILDLMSAVHREDFIPEPYRKLAFAEVNIPLPHGQVTMPPRMEARLLQSLEITAGDGILEIGTGCAYLTALLAKLGGEVLSIDIFPIFTDQAGPKLEQCHITNVSLLTGNAAEGWPVHAPYDVIAVTGSIPQLNPMLEDQLAIGGRMFVIVGESPVMEAMLITRTSENGWAREVLFETDFPPLEGVSAPDKFRF